MPVLLQKKCKAQVVKQPSWVLIYLVVAVEAQVEAAGCWVTRQRKLEVWKQLQKAVPAA